MNPTQNNILMDEFDPITAFTNVTAARERFILAQRAVVAAQNEQGSALAALNDAQMKYDQVTEFLKKHSPPESMWGP